MSLSKNENIGLAIGSLATVVPGMIMSGFMPEFNVLPTWGWMAIATVGSMFGGMVAAEHRIPGAITGGVVGLGALLGVVFYSTFRMWVFPTDTVLRLELALAALIGSAPGMIAFVKLAKMSNREAAQ